MLDDLLKNGPSSMEDSSFAYGRSTAFDGVAVGGVMQRHDPEFDGKAEPQKPVKKRKTDFGGKKKTKKGGTTVGGEKIVKPDILLADAVTLMGLDPAIANGLTSMGLTYLGQAVQFAKTSPDAFATLPKTIGNSMDMPIDDALEQDVVESTVFRDYMAKDGVKTLRQAVDKYHEKDTPLPGVPSYARDWIEDDLKAAAAHLSAMGESNHGFTADTIQDTLAKEYTRFMNVLYKIEDSFSLTREDGTSAETRWSPSDDPLPQPTNQPTVKRGRGRPKKNP